MKRKSWIVEISVDGGEFFSSTRNDTGRTMVDGYPAKWQANRRASSLRACLDKGTKTKVRVVPCIDHPGVAPFPPMRLS